SLYPVTVVATGIAPGTGWTLTLSNGVSVVSAGASVSLPLVNGTYGFRASAPGEGRIPVVGQFSVAGAPLALSIAFRPFLSPVTFEETGLPNGTAWTIHFENGTLLTSTGPTISIDQANGSYAYTVSAADGSYGSPGGTYRVDGAPLAEMVRFTRPMYDVEFLPTGVAAGTPWWLALTGRNRTISP
ncbi:thermopsin precursor, partial [mine drainage metagenome]